MYLKLMGCWMMSKRIDIVVENCKECPFLQGDVGNIIHAKCTKLNLTGLVKDLWKVCPLPNHYESGTVTTPKDMNSDGHWKWNRIIS